MEAAAPPGDGAAAAAAAAAPPAAEPSASAFEPYARGAAGARPSAAARAAAAVLGPGVDPAETARWAAALVILCAVAYGVLFFGLGDEFLPGHAAWCTLLLWASALVGGGVALLLRLPRVIGMLGAGLLLENATAAVDAFPNGTWGAQMRAAALATIFLRCGLELDFGTMRRFKAPAARLALAPGLVEAFFDAGLGVALFDMPFTLALTMGFILKAVGPGLVVPAMFELQRGRLGTGQGVPSTVVIAASFDDIVAITGYAIFSSIAITSDSGSSSSGDDASESDTNVAWEIAKGPAQVVFGVAGGVAAGLALGATRLWATRATRFVGAYGAALLLMFFLVYYDLLSGGALAALFVGLVASNAWEKGWPRAWSLGPSFRYSPEIEHALKWVWLWVAEPMLFVTVGARINFSDLAQGTVGRAVAIVCAGVSVRAVATFFTMSGFGYNWREKLFYALAWTPKATVQAALAAAPLALIEDLKVGADDYDTWVAWGNDILTTAILAIVVCGTAGTAALHLAAPRLLEREEGGDDAGFPESPAKPGAPPPPAADGASPERAGRSVAAGASSANGDGLVRRRPSTVATAAAALENWPGGRRPPPHAPAARAKSAEPAPPDRSGRGPGGIGDLVGGADMELVAQYIDAIRRLTRAVQAEGGGGGGGGGGPAPQQQQQRQEELRRLGARVDHLQRRVETEVGRREPSVRELFRTASAISQQRFTVAHHAHGGSGVPSAPSGPPSLGTASAPGAAGRGMPQARSRSIGSLLAGWAGAPAGEPDARRRSGSGRGGTPPPPPDSAV